MSDTPDILKRILRHKAREVSERSARVSLREMGGRAERAVPVRPFAAALADRIRTGEAAVIAELKRASPSRGVLREPFAPAQLARGLEQAGAAALSVLTDREFFQGDDEFLVQALGACNLPALRKDFIIDAWQVYEARALGADCILLIVAALGDASLAEFAGLAAHLGMDALVEVHDEEELERALALDVHMVGVNNRDLRTFETTLETTLRLRERIPRDRLVVTESGVHTPEDVARLRAGGVHAFLVGEALMQAPDPGARLRELFAAQ